MTFIIPFEAKVGDRIGPSRVTSGGQTKNQWLVITEAARCTIWWYVRIAGQPVGGSEDEEEARRDALEWVARLTAEHASADLVMVTKEEIWSAPDGHFVLEPL